ncbi:MAG: hypothetical protein G3M78_10570 [Candidatus Nitrohelix vancouverensis]|uniref:Uncharacterized protein n=1 Tax=Candidatus Nitrohelix vancouverensis TaxID=2705534 RepID=A0A7T0G3Y0_9BACT|nr:MAG: hypothetical protein G3M78_10570 [Candidatus Nitrohelix vancouverensis]
MKSSDKKPPERRKENLVFTVLVHTGYTILILSMIGWMVYMEYILP